MRSSRISRINFGKFGGAHLAPDQRAARAVGVLSSRKSPGWLCEPESAGWRDDASDLLAACEPSACQIRLEADLRFVRAL